MKIKINYDLIDKIREAKTGFSLQKNSKRTMKFASINTLLWIPINMQMFTNILQAMGRDFLYFILGYFVTFSSISLYMKNQNIENAIDELKSLAKILRENYIKTDNEILLNSYEYETNYKIFFDESKIPHLKQKKYILVPVVDRDGEKEVSLVQEHVIGSKEYDLSYGSSKKALRLVYNSSK